MTDPAGRGLRVLAVAETWAGSNAYGWVRAFRRAGHSVRVVDPSRWVPGAWRRKTLRAARRTMEPMLVAELAAAIEAEARALRPDLLFVYKGRYVTPAAVDAVREGGAVTVNVYPDVSLTAHGPLLPEALPRYHRVFTTKPWGVADLERVCGVGGAVVLPHGFDPEVHLPVPLRDDERDLHEQDVVFVGTWSPKKQALLEALMEALPEVSLSVWGEQWGDAAASLGAAVQGRGLYGLEYAKALGGAKVALGLLSERRLDASHGDTITSRTFQIPACGGFLLHERTDDLAAVLTEGEECACFEGPGELVDEVRRWLPDEAARSRVREAGRARIVAAHSLDHRLDTLLAAVAPLLAGSGGEAEE